LVRVPVAEGDVELDFGVAGDGNSGVVGAGGEVELGELAPQVRRALRDADARLRVAAEVPVIRAGRVLVGEPAVRVLQVHGRGGGLGGGALVGVAAGDRDAGPG